MKWYTLSHGYGEGSGRHLFKVTCQFRVTADVAVLALGMHFHEGGKAPRSIHGLVRIARQFRHTYGTFDGQGNEDFTRWGGVEWGPEETKCWNRAVAVVRKFWPVAEEVPEEVTEHGPDYEEPLSVEHEGGVEVEEVE